MPHVELDAERGRADLLDDRGGVPERVEDRPALDAFRLERLERDAQVELLRFGRYFAQAAERGRAVARAGEAEDGGGLECREPVERAEDRVDSVTRIGRAGEEWQRQDRGDGRDGGGRAEAALAQERERVVVGTVAELQLPDADPVQAGGAYVRTSSAKPAASVLTCETEIRGRPSGSLDTPGDRVTGFDI